MQGLGSPVPRLSCLFRIEARRRTRSQDSGVHPIVIAPKAFHLQLDSERLFYPTCRPTDSGIAVGNQSTLINLGQAGRESRNGKTFNRLL